MFNFKNVCVTINIVSKKLFDHLHFSFFLQWIESNCHTKKNSQKNHLWNCLQLFNGLLNCRSSYSTMSSFQIHYKGNCTESECKTLIVLENYIYVITKIHVRYIKKFWIIWFVQERIIQNYCIIRYNGNGIIFSKCNNTYKL